MGHRPPCPVAATGAVHVGSSGAVPACSTACRLAAARQPRLSYRSRRALVTRPSINLTRCALQASAKRLARQLYHLRYQSVLCACPAHRCLRLRYERAACVSRGLWVRAAARRAEALCSRGAWPARGDSLGRFAHLPSARNQLGAFAVVARLARCLVQLPMVMASLGLSAEEVRGRYIGLSSVRIACAARLFDRPSLSGVCTFDN